MTTQEQHRAEQTRRELAAELRGLAYEAELEGNLAYAMKCRALANGARAGSDDAITQGCEVLIAGGELG